MTNRWIYPFNSIISQSPDVLISTFMCIIPSGFPRTHLCLSKCQCWMPPLCITTLTCPSPSGRVQRTAGRLLQPPPRPPEVAVLHGRSVLVRGRVLHFAEVRVRVVWVSGVSSLLRDGVAISIVFSFVCLVYFRVDKRVETPLIHHRIQNPKH